MARDGDTVLRLFYGILLPPQIQRELAGLQERLAQSGARVKWVEPDNLHITLVFLGELPAIALHDLKLAGAKVGAETSAWDLNLRGVGAFPKLRQPHTLWAGVGEGAEGVAHLAGQLAHMLVEEALAACDDRKPFHAHCTLGRVKPQRNVQPLVTQMQQESGFTAGPVCCDQFELLASELSEAGPKYTLIGSFALGRSH